LAAASGIASTTGLVAIDAGWEPSRVAFWADSRLIHSDDSGSHAPGRAPSRTGSQPVVRPSSTVCGASAATSARMQWSCTTGRLLVHASAARPTASAMDGVAATVSTASPAGQLAVCARRRLASVSPAQLQPSQPSTSTSTAPTATNGQMATPRRAGTPAARCRAIDAPFSTAGRSTSR
jgi:hypothetical protein